MVKHLYQCHVTQILLQSEVGEKESLLGHLSFNVKPESEWYDWQLASLLSLRVSTLNIKILQSFILKQLHLSLRKPMIVFPLFH